jgi:signal transduction histidine kinase
MTFNKAMVPDNEMERLLSLSSFEIDYSAHKDSFKNLTKLAAKIAGTNISLVNLIDSYTQWTISNHGLDIDQMLREDSACQYTILEPDYFEVEDMLQDARFKDKWYVTGDPRTRYYLGVPLIAGNGLNLGALCVLDQEKKHLNSEQIDLLKIIAAEIVNKLRIFSVTDTLKAIILESERSKRRVAHDIRGPLAGIVGLSQIIEDQGSGNDMNEVLEFMSLIRESGNGLIDMTADILGNAGVAPGRSEVEIRVFDLTIFKERLQKLYGPQARHKHVDLVVTTGSDTERITVSENKLIQITGNLVSNALKFTPSLGQVKVDISWSEGSVPRRLKMTVSDTGSGVSEDTVQSILSGHAVSTAGTAGEQGFGFGLAFVKHLIDELRGELHINATPGSGSTFTALIPQ